MSRERTVKERDLQLCMLKIRELRRMAHNKHLDPWAVRQALVIALEIDTHVALKLGIPLEKLAEFDAMVATDVGEWIQGIEV